MGNILHSLFKQKRKKDTKMADEEAKTAPATEETKSEEKTEEKKEEGKAEEKTEDKTEEKTEEPQKENTANGEVCCLCFSTRQKNAAQSSQSL